MKSSVSKNLRLNSPFAILWESLYKNVFMLLYFIKSLMLAVPRLHNRENESVIMNRRNGSLERIDEEETLTLSSAKLDNIFINIVG